MKKKYYISTAIAYSSGKPHIGNTYEIILADAIARYKRLEGYDVYFQTGTDEHGQKIQDKAIEANYTPQEYVDNISREIKRIWDIVNSSYDNFVRTTDESHKKTVQAIFKKLFDQGDIYKSVYEGWYCKPCESFFTDSQLINNHCPDCGREVSKEKEESYFFKMSKYQKQLEEYIENNPTFLEPVSRKNEMINNFIKPGLQDLCVSRSSLKWGVPVLFDEDHVIYVWIDALSNYITFLGYNPEGNHSDEFKKFWPADVHLIGKDIFRFHSIYWPTLLLALGVELPKKVFGHPWLLMDGGKMSKSTGNILYADDLVNEFGVDPIRYYVLRETPYANDGVISRELIIERYNTDLVNILGNLVNRTITMVHKYCEGTITDETTIDEKLDGDLIAHKVNLKNEVTKAMDNLKVGEAIELIFEEFRRCNKYIDTTAPWLLAKETDKASKARLHTILYNLLDSIYTGAVLLQAFLPDTAERILNQLNCKDRSFVILGTHRTFDKTTRLNSPEILFERIDKDTVN